MKFINQSLLGIKLCCHSTTWATHILFDLVYTQIKLIFCRFTCSKIAVLFTGSFFLLTYAKIRDFYWLKALFLL